MGNNPKTSNKGQQRRLTNNSRAPKGKETDNSAICYIRGVLLIAISLVLFVLAILPKGDGILNSIFAEGLHLLFGIFCYILPLFALFVGILQFKKSNKRFSSPKFILGILIIILFLDAFISLFCPIAILGKDDSNLLFTNNFLINYGGYVGNGISWIFITLLGKTISGILFVAFIVIGLILCDIQNIELFKKISVKKDQPPNDMQKQEKHEIFDGNFLDKIKIGKNGDLDDSVLKDYSLNSPTKVMTENVRHRPVPKTRLNPQDNHINDDNNYENLKTTKIDDTNIEKLPNADKTINFTKENKAIGEYVADPNSDFKLPSMNLLAEGKINTKKKTHDIELKKVAKRLQNTLMDFGISASVVGWVAGPTVTLFKIELPPGLRVSRIQNLGTDLALALATSSVRIFAPIPGTNYVGIEVPNSQRETVYLKDVLKDAPAGPLQIAIGKDVEGNSVVCDLAKMPHLLIGGTTGSGKSVSVNAMIMSILMRATPDDVRFIMVDPKRVEFTPYNGIPHLYAPVVTEPKEAASALAWGVAEMERRLKLMSEVACRNIMEYNKKVASRALDEITKTGENNEEVKKHIHLPYIVIIIDELADLMMSVGKEVETYICRIAQLARAAGIHLIVATQRPSTNVVTGLIKSNITNRIAFNVASSIDSRVILDTTGAEDLIGLGDLLLSKPEFGKPLRIQGPFVSEAEISSVVEFIKAQGSPEYHNEILNMNISGIGDTSPNPTDNDNLDPNIWEAAEIVVNAGFGSTSNIQRKLKVGYSRAGRIMDQLESLGIVGGKNGSKPREVLVDTLELESIRAFNDND